MKCSHQGLGEGETEGLFTGGVLRGWGKVEGEAHQTWVCCVVLWFAYKQASTASLDCIASWSQVLRLHMMCLSTVSGASAQT